MKDLISNFSLERVSKSGAVFDEEKLKWFNREYIKMLSDETFIEHARPFLPEWISATGDTMKRLVPVLRDKVAVFSDIETLFSPSGELAFANKLSDYPSEKLLWKKNPDAKASSVHLEECRTRMEKLRFESFTADAVKVAIWDYAEAKGRGDVLWPLRVALTGQDKSPDPFVSAAILGKDEALKRIDLAVKKLG
jgi:glutamyl/glutaminyl-tRNA synthetase